MPRKTTVKRAREDLRSGKRATTAAGEFVREEMEHVRRGEHGARSPKQAIAIGLSKARRAGVPLEPPAEGRADERTRRSAQRDYATGRGERSPRAPSRRRAAATKRALEREPRSSASHRALSRQAKRAGAARRRRGRATAGSPGRRRGKGRCRQPPDLDQPLSPTLSPQGGERVDALTTATSDLDLERDRDPET